MSLRAPLAEFLGTFFLCFAGIASIVCLMPPIGSQMGLVGVALAHGLALSVAVSTFGGVSGAHVNPAVTAGMLVTGRIAPKNAVIYVIAQCLGAIAAAAICNGVFPAEAVTAGHLGVPPPAEWASQGVVFVMEFVMTFLLVTEIGRAHV